MSVGLARGRWTAARQRAGPPWSLRLVALGVVVAAALPLAYLVIRALEGGADAFTPLLRQRTLELLASTVALGLGVGAGSVALGVPLAWLTTRTDLPGSRPLAVVAIAPLAVPSYVLAFAFVAALGPGGWLVSVPWIIGLPGAVFVLTLTTTPFVVLATRAALIRLDPSVEEAARSLGDGAWSAARVGVLPVILPAVGVGALLAMLYAISDFGAVSILRFDSLARAIYTQYRLSFDRSGAAALALVLVGVAFVLVWLERRLRRRSHVGRAAARRLPPRVVALGRWRWPALVFCITVALASLVLPALTIAIWLSRGLAAGVDVRFDADLVTASLTLAGSSALLAGLVAIPLAILIVGYPGRWAALVEHLTYGTHAVPAISLALAFVFLTLNAVPALYQTLPALIFALGLRFLVQPVGALRGPLLQVSPRTVEAARSLGHGPIGVLRTITLPLVLPGLVAGAGIVFLSVLKELPLTLMLAPTGMRTLAIGVWDAAREGFYTQAAVPAAVLVVVSLLSVVVLVRGEDAGR